MKKWKQLVVFVMILTMVMGMTSFAAPGDTRSTNAKTVSGDGSTSGDNLPPETEEPSSLSNNEIAAPNEVPKLSTEGETAELVKKLELKLTPQTKENLTENAQLALENVLKKLLAKDFGKATTQGKKDGAKLFLLDIKINDNKNLNGKVVQLELDCATMKLPATTAKGNLRLLHYNSAKNAWESRPIVSYNATTQKLVAQFDSFSPFCVAYSETKVDDNETDVVKDPTQIIKPEEIKDPNTGTTPPTTDPDDNKPTDPDDNKPTDPDDSKPADPTITSDKWKLTYSLVANKYNTFVLRWEAAEAGKYEVWYSATPEDSNSFKRLTTTKKTTYKFTKAALDVRYGFKIRVKGSDKFSETLYITNTMNGRVTATNVYVINKSYNSLQVKWDKIPGVKKYAIYRDGVKIAEKSGTKMTDKGLVTGRDYTYTVQPISMKGAKGTFAGPVSAPVTNAPKMKGISSINVKAVDSATLRITWSKVKGANYYTVCEVVTVDGKEVLEPVAENVTTNRCTVINLLAGSEHTYRVIAHAGNGHSVISKAKTARDRKSVV